jgi:hypothetical protein
MRKWIDLEQVCLRPGGLSMIQTRHGGPERLRADSGQSIYAPRHPFGRRACMGFPESRRLNRTNTVLLPLSGRRCQSGSQCFVLRKKPITV